jgi:hypothetical protein
MILFASFFIRKSIKTKCKFINKLFIIRVVYSLLFSIFATIIHHIEAFLLLSSWVFEITLFLFSLHCLYFSFSKTSLLICHDLLFAFLAREGFFRF